MALYRRYRPQQFQDVIGQEQVTKPLMAALRADKTAHAYLFSGPRGCGKTTSARILARCLNCEKAPTDTPCGECESCRELALSGSGSLDVVEMDAASHGGVDDARDLIERASFAPARDRYKIFIIDEAHMVSNQGFNALLKLVEEPPPHIKFIFATTEPEKVIGTIRSRTHHYPFRLVPPDVLESFLGGICADEGIDVGAGVLPLVVRSGGGSVRDSLSVLDQLMGGSEGGVVNYQDAVGLLGYTDGSLLDDFVEALAVNDGATVFSVVDRVVQSGHDPRRFVEDLLQRLRDLIVIALAGEHATDVLSSVPQDQIERMMAQSGHLGAAKASRSADLVNDALSSMVGATSPRLQLELLCARLLIPEPSAVLPSAGTAERGPGERPARPASAQRPGGTGRPAATGQPATAQGPVASGDLDSGDADRGQGTASGLAQNKQRPAAQATNPMVPGRQINPAWAAADESSAAPRASQGSQVPQASRSAQAPHRGQQPTQQAAPQQSRAPQSQQPISSSGATSGAPAGTVDLAGGPAPKDAAPENADAAIIRQRWNEVVAAVQSQSRSTAALIQTNAQVGSLAGGVLTLTFQTAGLATTFNNRGHGPRVEAALHDVLGIRATVQGSVGGAPQAPEPRSQGAGAAAPQSNQAMQQPHPMRQPQAVPEQRPEPVSQSPAETAQTRQIKDEISSVSRESHEQPAASATSAQDVEEAWPTPVAPPRSSARSVGGSVNVSPPTPADPAGVLAQLVDNPVEEILARSTVPTGHRSSLAPDEGEGSDVQSELLGGSSANAEVAEVPSIAGAAPITNVSENGDVLAGSSTHQAPASVDSSTVAVDSESGHAASVSGVGAATSGDSSESGHEASVPETPIASISEVSSSPSSGAPSSSAAPAVSHDPADVVPAPPFDEYMVPPPLDEEPDEPFYAQQMPVPPRPQDFDQSANNPTPIPPRPQQSAQQPPVSVPQRPQGFGQSTQSPQSAPRSNSIASRIWENHGTGQPQGNGGFGNGEFGGYRGNSGYSGTSLAPGGQQDAHDDDEVSVDDPTIAQSNLVGIDVVLDTFHGTVIEEILGKKEI